MYCSIRRYEGVTNAAEVARRLKDGFAPLLSKISGFVAYYCVDAGNGVLLATNVFENQAGADESNRRAAEWVKGNLKDLLPNPPQIIAGEVVATAGRIKAAA
jgi:hypothetical protein